MAKKAAKKPAKSAAKAKKAGTKPVEQPDTPDAPALKFTPASKLRTLLKRCETHAQNAATESGTMGELIRDHVEQYHLDRVAFQMVRRLSKIKDPNKLAVTLASLDKYIEDAGLDKIADAQGLLFDGDPDEEGSPEPQDVVPAGTKKGHNAKKAAEPPPVTEEKDVRPQFLKDREAAQAAEKAAEAASKPVDPAVKEAADRAEAAAVARRGSVA